MSELKAELLKKHSQEIEKIKKQYESKIANIFKKQKEEI